MTSARLVAAGKRELQVLPFPVFAQKVCHTKYFNGSIVASTWEYGSGHTPNEQERNHNYSVPHTVINNFHKNLNKNLIMVQL